MPRSRALTRSASKDVALAAGAQSTAHVSFSGHLVTWKDLPARTRRAASRRSRLVAEAVQVDERRHRDGGRVLELATGWRAYEDAVVLAEVARPVAPGRADDPDASAPWEHRSVRVWRVAGPPRRRRGVIDVADELGAGERAAGRLLGIVASGHGQAANAWSYLPQAVRTAGERIVPDPTVWLGQITQASEDGLPLRQDVCALRMSAERAVVIVATRELARIRGAGIAYHEAQMARLPWIVEQVGLELEGAPEGLRLEAGRDGGRRRLVARPDR